MKITKTGVPDSTIKKTEKRYCQYEKNVSNTSLKDENYIMWQIVIVCSWEIFT